MYPTRRLMALQSKGFVATGGCLCEIVVLVCGTCLIYWLFSPFLALALRADRDRIASLLSLKRSSCTLPFCYNLYPLQEFSLRPGPDAAR